MTNNTSPLQTLEKPEVTRMRFERSDMGSVTRAEPGEETAMGADIDDALFRRSQQTQDIEDITVPAIGPAELNRVVEWGRRKTIE